MGTLRYAVQNGKSSNMQETFSRVVCAFFGVTVLVAFPSLARSEELISVPLPEKSSLSCYQAIDSVKRELTRRGYFVPVKYRNEVIQPKVTVDKDEMQKTFYDYPSERTDTIIFHLSGEMDKLYSGLMSSPHLMTVLSAKIMSGCEHVGLVEFAHWWEGSEYIGYFPDNIARPFTNVGARDAAPYQWGYYSSD